MHFLEQNIFTLTAFSSHLAHSIRPRTSLLRVYGTHTGNRHRAPADNDAFHFYQLYIILNRTANLLEVFADGLQDGTYHPFSVQ